jgi:saccharopine dehydrogenase-like NADP-dependent oxidoreductase
MEGAVKVLVAGTGKIGSLIAGLLANTGDYDVSVIDQDFKAVDYQRVRQQVSLTEIQQDIHDTENMRQLLREQKFDAVISSLPFYCNKTIVQYAKEFSMYYFDLTEDTEIAKEVKRLANDTDKAFVPQCGLAPGFISIVTHSLMQAFDSLETVKMRVGALPVNSNNALQYCLTWSTEGLINEYANVCYGLEHGQLVALQPLQGIETIKIDGVTYEAFNTSGGIGNLAESCLGKVNEINYKTIRYPGHCQRISFLMNDLKLKDDLPTLKRILEYAIPKTYQDVVIVYVSVMGRCRGEFVEQNYVNKVYPQTIFHHDWSAIQVTTAASVSAVVDMVLGEKEKYHGFIGQEQFKLNDFLNNRFGQYYES